jgi:hypothetical protein
LWNPLDYLRLLYWVYFFPQAIRWYVKKFGKFEYQETGGYTTLKELLSNDPVQRKLIIQAFFIIIFYSVPIYSEFSVPWTTRAAFLILAVVLCLVISTSFDVARGIALSVIFAVWSSSAAYVMHGMWSNVLSGVMLGITLGLILGALFGIMVLVLVAITSGISIYIWKLIARGLMLSLLISVMLVMYFGILEGALFIPLFIIGMIISFIVMLNIYLYYYSLLWLNILEKRNQYY